MVIKAAKAAQIHERILSFPDGRVPNLCVCVCKRGRVAEGMLMEVVSTYILIYICLSSVRI